MKLAYNYAHLAIMVSIVDFALSVYNAFSATLMCSMRVLQLQS